jgi:hypothetical protein
VHFDAGYEHEEYGGDCCQGLEAGVRWTAGRRLMGSEHAGRRPLFSDHGRYRR